MSHSGAVNEVIFDSIWHRAKKEEKSTAKDIYLVYSWCHACSSSSWIHSWIYVCINTRKEKKLPHSRTTLRFLHLKLIGTLIKFVFITWLKCYSIYIKNILFVSRFCFPERCYCDIVCFLLTSTTQCWDDMFGFSFLGVLRFVMLPDIAWQEVNLQESGAKLWLTLKKKKLNLPQQNAVCQRGVNCVLMWDCWL